MSVVPDELADAADREERRKRLSVPDLIEILRQLPPETVIDSVSMAVTSDGPFCVMGYDEDGPYSIETLRTTVVIDRPTGKLRLGIRSPT